MRKCEFLTYFILGWCDGHQTLVFPKSKVFESERLLLSCNACSEVLEMPYNAHVLPTAACAQRWNNLSLGPLIHKLLWVIGFI